MRRVSTQSDVDGKENSTKKHLLFVLARLGVHSEGSLGHGSGLSGFDAHFTRPICLVVWFPAGQTSSLMGHV